MPPQNERLVSDISRGEAEAAAAAGGDTEAGLVP